MTPLSKSLALIALALGAGDSLALAQVTATDVPENPSFLNSLFNEVELRGRYDFEDRRQRYVARLKPASPWVLRTRSERLSLLQRQSSTLQRQVQAEALRDQAVSATSLSYLREAIQLEEQRNQILTRLGKLERAEDLLRVRWELDRSNRALKTMKLRWKAMEALIPRPVVSVEGIQDYLSEPASSKGPSLELSQLRVAMAENTLRERESAGYPWIDHVQVGYDLPETPADNGNYSLQVSLVFPLGGESAYASREAGWELNEARLSHIRKSRQSQQSQEVTRRQLEAGLDRLPNPPAQAPAPGLKARLLWVDQKIERAEGVRDLRLQYFELLDARGELTAKRVWTQVEG